MAQQELVIQLSSSHTKSAQAEGFLLSSFTALSSTRQSKKESDKRSQL